MTVMSRMEANFISDCKALNSGSDGPCREISDVRARAVVLRIAGVALGILAVSAFLAVMFSLAAPGLLLGAGLLFVAAHDFVIIGDNQSRFINSVVDPVKQGVWEAVKTCFTAGWHELNEEVPFYFKDTWVSASIYRFAQAF